MRLTHADPSETSRNAPVSAQMRYVGARKANPALAGAVARSVSQAVGVATSRAALGNWINTLGATKDDRRLGTRAGWSAMLVDGRAGRVEIAVFRVTNEADVRRQADKRAAARGESAFAPLPGGGGDGWAVELVVSTQPGAATGPALARAREWVAMLAPYVVLSAPEREMQ